MKSFLCSKKYVSVIMLVVFMFSANAVCYGRHFVEELGHGYSSAAETSKENPADCHSSSSVLEHHHHDGKNTHHEDGKSCCNAHSHFSIVYDPLLIKYAVPVTFSRAIEPFVFIPEVFLDKFIPPQNFT